MKIVIDLSEQDYELARNYPDVLFGSYGRAIAKGTPIPKGHGRLIDADLIKNQFPMWIDNFSSCEVNKTISKAPTIIEADEEVEG